MVVVFAVAGASGGRGLDGDLNVSPCAHRADFPIDGPEPDKYQRKAGYTGEGFR